MAAAGVVISHNVFTEHGALKLASVLNTEKAIQASIQIVRAFIRLRELLATHQELARQLAEIEKKYNAEIKAIFEAIQKLTFKDCKQHGYFLQYEEHWL